MAARYTKGIDDVVSVIFMLLAVAALVVFFVSSNRLPFWILGGVAVMLRLTQYILRTVARYRQRRRHNPLDQLDEPLN